MGKKKKEQQTDITCYFCSIYPSLPIIRKDGNNDNNITKECNGNRILGDYPVCDKFVPTTYFWCDRDANRISLEICSKRIKTPYTGCSKHCRQGTIARQILESFMDSRIFKRVEIELSESKPFKRVEIEYERPIPRISNKGGLRRIDMDGNPIGNPKHQTRSKLEEHIGRIFARVEII